MRRGADGLPASPDTIRRFVTAERLLHWAIAIPFLGCLVSAMVLVVVYNPDPTRPYRYVFAWMHRVCGTGLVVCPSLVVLATLRRHWHIHLYNVRQAWVWRFDDIKWLALMGPAALSKRIILPDQGKFNAAEKLNFMMVMSFPPLFIASGVLIWFPDSTGLGAFFPWIVHFGLVALATPLVLGHMIMATINPSTRVGLSGMISGFVSREWAAHHYTRWFREQFPHLAHEHAGESTHEADVMTPANAGTELGSQPLTVAVDQFPLATIEESPVPAVRAPLDDAALGESMVRVPTSPSNPVFAQARAALASLQAHAQPLVHAGAAAQLQQSGSAPAVDHGFDRLRRTGLLGDVVVDAAAGIYKPGFVVAETEDAALPAGNDA